MIDDELEPTVRYGVVGPQRFSVIQDRITALTASIVAD